MSASRYNAGKPRFALISSAALTELAKVLTFGAIKYADHNWRKGLSWSACADSLLRHVHAWLDGEDIDQESGLHHMAHVMCNAMFLVEHALRGQGVDDRYKIKEVAEAAPAPKLQSVMVGPGRYRLTMPPTCGASNCNCIVNEEQNARYRENVKQLISNTRIKDAPDVL